MHLRWTLTLNCHWVRACTGQINGIGEGVRHRSRSQWVLRRGWRDRDCNVACVISGCRLCPGDTGVVLASICANRLIAGAVTYDRSLVLCGDRGDSICWMRVTVQNYKDQDEQFVNVILYQWIDLCDILWDILLHNDRLRGQAKINTERTWNLLIITSAGAGQEASFSPSIITHPRL